MGDKKIEVGSVVALKSGGAKMTVCSLHGEAGEQVAGVSWFDEHHVLHHANIQVKALNGALE